MPPAPAAAAVAATTASAVITTVSTPQRAFPGSTGPARRHQPERQDAISTSPTRAAASSKSLRAGATRTPAGSTPGFHDGVGSEARFRNPSGIASQAAGILIRAIDRRAMQATRSCVSSARGREWRSGRRRLTARSRRSSTRIASGSSRCCGRSRRRKARTRSPARSARRRGTQGSERFHAGIDVRIDDGTPVQAVRDGIVTDPIATDDYGSLNEWLRIGGGELHPHPRGARARQRVDSIRNVSSRTTMRPRERPRASG